MTMDKIAAVLAMLILIIGCSKDEDPIVEVRLEMKESERFQQAEVGVSVFSFFEKDTDSGQISKSIVQQWEGTEVTQDLTDTKISNILESTHWELTDVVGVKPDFSITVVENDTLQDLTIDYISYIALDEPVSFMANEQYEILISIDTDSAVVENNGNFNLDWNYVTGTVSVK